MSQQLITSNEISPSTSISAGQITSVNANAITGLITSAQIANVAATQITGTVYVANTSILGSITPTQLSTGAPLWSPSGNVSISGTLSVAGNTTIENVVISNTTIVTSDMIMAPVVNTQIINAGTSNTLTILANNNTALFDANGNFGLGVSNFTTSGSNAKLAISAGNINLDDTYIIGWGGGTGRPNIQGVKANSALYFSSSAGNVGMTFNNTGLGIGTTPTSAKLTSYTTTGAQPAINATSIYPAASGAAVSVTVGNNSGSNNGGYGVAVYDKTDNAGGAQTGYGFYVSAPYDGSNSSGNTYALSKNGLYIDNIYSYYGVNSSTGNYNRGLNIQGGGFNYIKATTQIDGSIILGGNLNITGYSYTGSFYFSGGGTQTIYTLAVGENILLYAPYASYGAGDYRHGIYALAARNAQTANITVLGSLSGTGTFSITSAGVISYSAGGGNPATTILWTRLLY